MTLVLCAIVATVAVLAMASGGSDDLIVIEGPPVPESPDYPRDIERTGGVEERLATDIEVLREEKSN